MVISLSSLTFRAVPFVLCCVFVLGDSGFQTAVSSVSSQESSATHSPMHSEKKLTNQMIHQAWKECYMNQLQSQYVSRMSNSGIYPIYMSVFINEKSQLIVLTFVVVHFNI